MRTQQELLDRIKFRKNNDMLGFEVQEYINFLDFDNAKEYLKEGVTKEEWDKAKNKQEDIKQIMTDYMEFAWDKANSFRGISAERSIMHYVAWLWIDGSEEANRLSETIENYECYGKPQLVEICKYLGIDHNKYDDGVRRNSE